MNARPVILEEVGATTHLRVRTARTHVHSNLTSCILFGRETALSVECTNGTLWGDAILVDANWAHVVNFHGGAADVIYVQPNQLQCKGARALTNASRRIVEEHIDCWSEESAANLFASLGFEEPPRDPAISSVRKRIDGEPMLRCSEAEASAIARLERTTMLRRFKRQTGMTFRAYKTWAALKHAARLVGMGEPMGVAGLDAGFADAAHFSRQYRATFGLSPREGRRCVLS